MVRKKKTEKELFGYLDLPKTGGREPLADMYQMALEFMKYQGEVAYETGKTQAILIASTASTMGVGWSALFFGMAQEDWLMAGLSATMVFVSTLVLLYWAPKMVDITRGALESLGAAKFYNKWLSDYAKSGAPEKRT